MNKIEVRELREEMGLTQEKFAKIFGVTIRTIQNWESGGKIPAPKIEMLRKIKTSPTETLMVTDSSIMRDRICKYLDSKGISRYSFYQTTGLSNGYLDKGGEIKLRNYEKIGYHFPDLNMDWVRTGEGSMLKAPTEPLIVADDAESFDKAVERYGSNLVPEYSSEFRGGQNGALVDSEHIVAYWAIPNAPKGAIIIQMIGNSMEPQLQSGSKLLLAPLAYDKDYPLSIPFGQVFGVVVSEPLDGTYSGHVKILRRHTDKALERSHYIARSNNRELFDDFEIATANIVALYKVMHCISSPFGL